MKWEDLRKSQNVEDRRGQRTGRSGYPGGYRRGGNMGGLLQLLFLLPGRSKWLVLLVVLGMFIFGGGGLFSNLTESQPTSSNITESQVSQQANSAEMEYVSRILGSSEDFWKQEFAKHGLEYKEPTLVLYEGMVQTSGCGFGSAQAGPFYCPADQKVYLDLSFMRDLSQRYQAPGDFAMAYVIAHEVGHHVQNQLGVMQDFQELQRRASKSQVNEASVRVELQADYLAGAWSKYVDEKGILEVGDIEEALQAAHAVGDDTLQKEAYGTVVPDSFTHGSAKQRQAWFYRGYQYGDLEHGDTFSTYLDGE
ncbi:KPN_02809 family neutral zinc metallopeptidase [Hutsoniella sourekii]|uniref:KPN_02809 family neutral zinc metallopeptidase n=1 Tax=Hutsoniella sourekii TaxID=87650 RepID=UPI000488EC27|nr:neutral zinc metallopeptidase [Hutsoniella sourekii]